MMRTKSNRRKATKRPLRWPSFKVNVRALMMPPLVGAVLLLALGAARSLLDQPVRTLIVHGTFERVTPLQVEAALASDLKKGLLSIDLETLRQRVQALDWADAVEVRRIWPDTLSISVTEHQAAARWGASGLLNVRGELFVRETPYEFPELPRLAGPPGSEHEVASLYLALRGRLIEAGLELESLSMDERGAWSVLLRGGQEIRLGRRDVGERLDRFFDAVRPALVREFDRVAYVDLRYTNGFAVGWAEPRAEVQLSQLRGQANSG
jgi:cell division protein FtsQ